MTEENEPVPILLEEWRAAVAATEGVRLFAGKAHILDIAEHGIRSFANEGDVEVWFFKLLSADRPPRSEQAAPCAHD